MYSIQTICTVVKGHFFQKAEEIAITHLVHDSRAISFPDRSLFFALQTPRQDGHKYISAAYGAGVRNFIISKELNVEEYSGANLILVPDTLLALQQLAAHHRAQFSIPVIGITGSNGKTIVKEWLYQLLHDDLKIIRSPKSYNSQIGVSLSVWQMSHEHQLAIFEAGISQAGEMETLARIIRPTIGVLTNIGEAHSEGFGSVTEKQSEKLKLFSDAEVTIASENYKDVFTNEQVFSWGVNADNKLQIIETKAGQTQTSLTCLYKEHRMLFVLPFTDEASVQNCITCICVLLHLGYQPDVINERLIRLHAVDMRLQLKKGVNGSTIINDSYSADLTSLHSALHFLAQQSTTQLRMVILSDFIESGKRDEDLYQSIADVLIQNKIQHVIVIGENISIHLPRFLPAQIDIQTFATTEEAIRQFTTSHFHNAIILVKGARKFGFERLVQLLETKVHQTVLEINLNAIAHNLKEYQRILPAGIKVMAMVKAFAYGSGGTEIANILQFNCVDYLGVAYADEGIELRKAGINVPVMVLNVEESSFASVIENNLQPVIYSFALLNSFEQYLSEQGLNNYPVHLEIETGMHRLGFSLQEIEPLAIHLKNTSLVKVESVFSHLAASEDAVQDAFTNAQAEVFQQSVHTLSGALSYPFLKHIANSAAAVRHPPLRLDMIRLGIGLYGVEVAAKGLNLQTVATLRSTIAQIKNVKAGETISYNRRGVVEKDSIIATVRIGYADGFSRRLGNGVGKLWVGGQLAPVIGSVCMDMVMIDVTGIPGIKEGDVVVVFGKELPVQLVAEWAGTIPYEIMTSVSHRVKRVYFLE